MPCSFDGIYFYLDCHDIYFVYYVCSGIYQETLVKALAKHFGVKVLIVDSPYGPGVSLDLLYMYSIFHKETLVNALAKHYGVRMLIFVFTFYFFISLLLLLFL